jgi:inosose dehydratase
MSTIQLAISPLTWSNDDMPELGGTIPLATCLSEMKQAGFTGTELGVKYPRAPEVLLPILQEHGLRVASGWCSGHLMARDVDEEWAAIAPHVALMRAAEVQAMVYGEVSNTVHGDINKPLSSRVHLSADDWRQYGQRLTKLAERLMSQAGIRLAFHHHMGTIVETREDILRLLENTGEHVGLTFDSGHSAFGGSDPVALLREVVARVAHVHFKDVRPAVLKTTQEENASFLDAVLGGAFTVPGDGVIDFAALVGVLKGADYKGWIVVEAEQDPAKAHPLTYARMAHDNISAYLSGVGYKAEAGGRWQA